MAGRTIRFDVPREVAFDYLVDPRNRPQWQSSLRRVSRVDGVPRAGQTWVDETVVPGMKPQMRTTALDRPRRWSESGTWRFVRADLTLTFEESGTGCDVDVDFRIHAFGPLGRVASIFSAPAVRGDLKRAARLLGERG